jgi:hypothetical protein
MPGAHDILQGSMPPDDLLHLLQPETAQLLRTISTRANQHQHPALPLEITTEAFQSCYTIVKECTSSSPSGRHVGHYKAVATCETLSSLHSMMMSIPFIAGFSPQRWCRIVDIMLEKQPGNARIHRLRIIALLESDFNQAVHLLIARPLSFHMEDNNMVPTMPYGSREGRQCVSAVINKQLAHDIVRHKKSIAAFIENDAIGCYNHMINNLLLYSCSNWASPHLLYRPWQRHGPMPFTTLILMVGQIDRAIFIALSILDMYQSSTYEDVVTCVYIHKAIFIALSICF